MDYVRNYYCSRDVNETGFGCRFKIQQVQIDVKVEFVVGCQLAFFRNNFQFGFVPWQIPSYPGDTHIQVDETPVNVPTLSILR
jgi:hypothetical protein